jgi:thiol-disulfide isomerase/thioredoxin
VNIERPVRGAVRLGSLTLLLLLSSGGLADELVTSIEASELAAELEARKGRVVLVNFWATWCRPCLDEIPDLQGLEADLGDSGFDLIAVSLDDAWSLETIVKPFLEKWFPTFSTYLSVENDMDTMVSVIDPAWNEVLPTSYVLGRDGEIAARIQGGSSAAEFAAIIRPEL